MKGEKKRCFNILWVINTYSWIFFNFSACCCNRFNQLWHIQILCDHANVNTVLLPSEFWTWGHRESQVFVQNKPSILQGLQHSCLWIWKSQHTPPLQYLRAGSVWVQIMQAKKVKPLGFSKTENITWTGKTVGVLYSQGVVLQIPVLHML